MGLSSKQVSSDGHGWSQTLLQAQTLELPKPASSMKRPLQPSQNQQQQTEPVKCPRCDSTNTKFCYFNNYNKLQPRHFCRTCKRHWTKGGTLRNVPVGGGRKNKRLKTSNTAAASTSTATASRVSFHGADQSDDKQQTQNLPYALGDQKNLSDILYQALTHPPSSLEMKDTGATDNIGSFSNSNLVLLQNHCLNTPYESTRTSFNTTPSSISTSFQLSNVINYAGETIDEPTNIIISSTSMPITSSSVTQPWQVASTSSGMDNMTSLWNWDDVDTFVSTDLNIPWDDHSDIKP